MTLPSRTIGTVGIYAGSFDPMTNGHVWMIDQALSLFDHLYVLVGTNPNKKHWFSAAERKRMAKEICSGKSSKVSLYAPYVDGLPSDRYLVDWAKEQKATHLIRGIRNSSDLDFEKVLRLFNGERAQNIETVFLMPPRNLSEVSSSFVKSLIGPAGWEQAIKKYVPTVVLEALKNRAKKIMNYRKKQRLFIEKFCAIINYRLPLSNQVCQVVDEHENSIILKLIQKYASSVFSLPHMSRGRVYHDINHIVDCCFILDECWQDVSQQHCLSQFDYDAIFLALAYHDIIYETYNKTDKTNEERSAEFAQQQLLDIKFDSDIIAVIVKLIKETDHSIAIDDNASYLTKLIRDIDLTGLGADSDRFDRNFHAIREEYLWAPEAEFMLGRMRFMQAMLSRDHIFATSYFREKFEKAARANLKRHIANLDQIINAKS